MSRIKLDNRLLSVASLVRKNRVVADVGTDHAYVVAYLIEKGYPADKLGEVIKKAQEERAAGKQVLVVRMNKNKKFQKEKLNNEGYSELVEFFNN